MDYPPWATSPSFSSDRSSSPAFPFFCRIDAPSPMQSHLVGPACPELWQCLSMSYHQALVPTRLMKTAIEAFDATIPQRQAKLRSKKPDERCTCGRAHP